MKRGPLSVLFIFLFAGGIIAMAAGLFLMLLNGVLLSPMLKEIALTVAAGGSAATLFGLLLSYFVPKEKK